MGSERDRIRMRTELGAERWDAVGSCLSDGDYLGFNRSEYRGAIAEYEKAWELLNTPWQRQTGGVEILKGIADFAILSSDPELAKETLERLRPRMARIANASLQAACDKLVELAGESAQEQASP